MNIPRCLAYHHDKENDFLVLQDVGVLGYGPLCRQSSLSYEQCKCVAESLARFHAISFGYKHENPEDYDKIADMLTETFYREDIYENWYKRFFVSIDYKSGNLLAKRKNFSFTEYGSHEDRQRRLGEGVSG